MTNELTYEQETVRSVFGAYINDLKAYSTKPDRPTIKKLEEVRNKAIKALEQPRWIPVSECLPKDRQGCIVTVQGNSKTFIDIVAYYAEERSFLYYKECNVLAWMPLPEPYKPESEGAE